MKVPVGPLVLEVPFDDAGPYMPAMGVATGPEDAEEVVELGRTALQKKAPARRYRRMLTTSMSFFPKGKQPEEVLRGEIARVAGSLRGKLEKEEGLTIAGNPAVTAEIHYLEQGMPVFMQICACSANGLIQVVSLAALHGKSANAVRTQFRGVLAGMKPFGS